MGHYVAIVSGGMDSVTLAHHLVVTEEHTIDVVSVDYGQRHVKELASAEACAARLDARWHLVNLRSLTDLLKGSALTDASVEVPEGHYADETMRATVVPNRNAMLLDIATAIAVANKADGIATAVHAGDHAIYPDCRPEFIDAYQTMARIANEGFAVDGFAVYAPFVTIGKHDIAMIGDRLGVPFELTWSCYAGGDVHCGKCGTCVERREAFALVHLDDPTTYAT